MTITYKEIKIMCPEGYEQQVMDATLMKIDGIVSQLTLTPTYQKKKDYEDEKKHSQDINKLSIK